MGESRKSAKRSDKLNISGATICRRASGGKFFGFDANARVGVDELIRIEGVAAGDDLDDARREPCRSCSNIAWRYFIERMVAQEKSFPAVDIQRNRELCTCAFYREALIDPALKRASLRGSECDHTCCSLLLRGHQLIKANLRRKGAGGEGEE